jgi:peptide/nickel transport system substrate-binding protein
MRGRFSILIALLMIVSMVLSACGGAAPAAQPPAAEAPAVEEATEAPAAEAPAAEAPAAEAPAADANALPRNETLYFNGQQWGSVVGWNPYASSNNNAMAISQGDNARVTMFETPYLYNMLDGKQYPLLADGDYTWNDAIARSLPSSSSRPPSGAMAPR